MAGAQAAIRLARGACIIMAASDLVNLSGLLDDAKCFALVRQHRWPDGVRCPGCDSSMVIREGVTTRSALGSGIAARRVQGALTISPASLGRASPAAAGLGIVPLL